MTGDTINVPEQAAHSGTVLANPCSPVSGFTLAGKALKGLASEKGSAKFQGTAVLSEELRFTKTKCIDSGSWRGWGWGYHVQLRNARHTGDMTTEKDLDSPRL